MNWFRKDADGKFLWPGFGENMRVLHGSSTASTAGPSRIESPLGWMPRYEDLDWRGLDYSRGAVPRADGDRSRRLAGSEVRQHEELFIRLLDRLPKEFMLERELLLSRLWRSPEHWELARELQD